MSRNYRGGKRGVSPAQLVREGRRKRKREMIETAQRPEERKGEIICTICKEQEPNLPVQEKRGRKRGRQYLKGKKESDCCGDKTQVRKKMVREGTSTAKEGKSPTINRLKVETQKQLEDRILSEKSRKGGGSQHHENHLFSD